MLFDYKNIKKLNHTEANIYQYIIQNMESVLEMNVRELADATYVSTATIVRFCRAMNCDGFIDFRNQLQKYYDGQHDEEQGPSTKVLIKELQSFQQPEYKQKMEQFAQYFLEADEILFLGIGNSAAIAQYAARYFSNIGFFSTAIIDAFYPPMIRTNSKVLLVVLSASGETIEVVDQVKQYVKTGVKVISICNNEDCTLGKMSECILTYSLEDIVLPQTYNLTSQVSVVYLIEMIAWILEKKEHRMAKVSPTTVH